MVAYSVQARSNRFQAPTQTELTKESETRYIHYPAARHPKGKLRIVRDGQIVIDQRKTGKEITTTKGSQEKTGEKKIEKKSFLRNILQT